MHHHVDSGTGEFPRDISGLPMATPTQIVELRMATSSS